MNSEILLFLNDKTTFLNDFKKSYEKEIKEEEKKLLFLESCGLLSIYSYTGQYQEIFKLINRKLLSVRKEEDVFSVLELALIYLKKEFENSVNSSVNKKLREYGIEITNFENYYEILLIKLISKLSEINKEEVEWWLYEDVEKKYYIERKSYDVSKPRDFLNFPYMVLDKKE